MTWMWMMFCASMPRDPTSSFTSMTISLTKSMTPHMQVEKLASMWKALTAPTLTSTLIIWSSVTSKCLKLKRRGRLRFIRMILQILLPVGQIESSTIISFVITIELQVLTVSARTSPEGDFRYGLAFRRSGDQYYAFTVSPRTKKWFALKSSPSGLEILQEGVEESIQDLDVDDLLRVDAQGPNLFFHINDQLVGQVTDPDYASGEVGFYVESFDSPNTHIHFDTFTIRDLELSLMCTVVNDGTLNVRSGPSKTFSQIAVLSNGDTVEALGKSPDGLWIKINVEGSEEPGWVGYTEGFLSCTPSIDLFPIVNP